MSLSTQPYKGSRDFFPEDKRLQDYLFKVMSRVVESFGYERYDAPIIEPLELYAAKTGEEIVNEQTYLFEDRGGRKVVIRPEMTPSVSRMVAAKRQELAYPLRWYSIPNLWRYERPQRGRLREHWQLNVDLFGIAGLEAEHEMLLITDALLAGYGADRTMFSVKVSSRKLMNHILNDYLGLNEAEAKTVSKLIDRMHKISSDEFNKQLDSTVESSKNKDKLVSILKVSDIKQLPEEIRNHESAKELSSLLAQASKSGLDNVAFDITIMRGFDYYTDIVFEVVDSAEENARSMFGGGRYDGLVGLFGVEPVPTVGFGMGDVTLANFLSTHKLLPKLTTETNVYIALVGNVYEKSQPIIAEMRKSGLNVAVDSSHRKLDKQIKSAVKKGVPCVVFIGENELDKGQFVLKDLKTTKEERLMLPNLIDAVKASIK